MSYLQVHDVAVRLLRGGHRGADHRGRPWRATHEALSRPGSTSDEGSLLVAEGAYDVALALSWLGRHGPDPGLDLLRKIDKAG